MSNKINIQTNNTTLGNYIDRVEVLTEIASGLPEAGSGGSSGGGVETCTVTIIDDGGYGMNMQYTDSNQNLLDVEMPNGAYDVAKNTILVYSVFSGSAIIPDTITYTEVPGYMMSTMYYINATNDFTISVE